MVSENSPIGIKNTSVRFFASGYCVAPSRFVNPKRKRGKTKFYAVWALLQMPEVGNVLFDTGYSEAFHQATQPFPQRLYRWATPVTVDKASTARAILQTQGIALESIKYVIISHFHADHIAALNDFPSAQFICSARALEEVKRSRGFTALKKGILPALLPHDFYKRVVTVENLAVSVETTPEELTLYQPFSTQAFQLVALPGHARGMLGFLYRDQTRAFFYATDASWSWETYRQRLLPRKIATLFFDSWPEFIRTQEKIRQFEACHPACQVVFTHCPKTLRLIENEL